MPTTQLADIAALIARHAHHDRECATAIDGLYLSSRSAPGQPLHVAQWPCYALVVQGAKSITAGAHTLRYGVGDFLLVTLDLPVVSQVMAASAQRPLLGLGMAIAPVRLAELMARLATPPATATTAPSPLSVAVQRASGDVLDATLRLLRLLDRPQDIAALAPLIEQELLYHLLMGPCGAQLLRLAHADSAANKVGRAAAWLRAHYAAPLRIDELARHAGMSASSLHHHFKAATALTPVQYQKRLRLHEARRLMLLERLDVGSAGFRVGYQSASQFSREYGRLYGLPPQRDVAAQREALRAAAQ